MTDHNDFDPATDPLVQAAERVADALQGMARVAESHGMSTDEIDDLAQQAVFAWQFRRDHG